MKNVTNEKEVAMKLNDFFSNAVINLKNVQVNFDPFSENVNYPTLYVLLHSVQKFIEIEA